MTTHETGAYNDGGTQNECHREEIEDKAQPVGDAENIELFSLKLTHPTP
jgi:hypothetical protein